jgi:hypothetical protein
MRVTFTRAARSMRQTVESKQFFFAKKNQKTFVYKALALPKPARLPGQAPSLCFLSVSLKAGWYNPLTPSR